jgi:hypothetical protein
VNRRRAARKRAVIWFALRRRSPVGELWHFTRADHFGGEPMRGESEGIGLRAFLPTYAEAEFPASAAVESQSSSDPTPLL